MRALLILSLALPTLALAQTRPLNDTGITWSGHATDGNAATCDPAHPAGQDCHYGSNAFNFTALDANGQPTTPSSGANPHPCVRDNLTGLIWEVKTDDGGLHDKDWTFTWYKTNSPDGNNGTPSGGSCGGTVPAGCDTEKFVDRVNATGWCGYTDWRMPTVKELEGIADLGRVNPAIDPTYFPNTPSSDFWSGSPYAGGTSFVWYVSFHYGYAYNYGLRGVGYHVRLVRGGQ